ncbi:MAG: hypothetical protein VZS44_08205 [Bacilli bacterium]|nr:hypothetical protein [Bacilli bacterium]
MEISREKIRKIIDNEHGPGYSKNVNLSGYVITRGDSFIIFRFLNVGENQRVVVYIDYIYVTNRKSLIKLLAWCINFWTGNGAQCLYFKSHKRKANYIEKTFPSLDFTVKDTIKNSEWKHAWKSTNGYKENQLLEAFVG